MRILALDYGDKRIGLALSSNGWVKPYGVIRNTLRREVVKKLKILAKKEGIEKIIIGFPKTFSGRKNLQIKKIEFFAQDLKKAIKLPLEFESEIFTTKLAKNSPGGRRGYFDDKAAAFILESYLKRTKNKVTKLSSSK